jgi:hypothetical protein
MVFKDEATFKANDEAIAEEDQAVSEESGNDEDVDD